ncbi:phosphocholine-specific phospholipase C [Dyella nitratireducens]|uniref:phospholipase C n=1 Tax=Dyella nitratireducens TaxID=1849580 RepID=A0ABQ1G8U0_9GAMM|nr:phospholipase C, phosphocholine-specific [Dyella nitratireducens]GGA38947.1 phospholipase C [Dyella nitratireducens]GLQ40381.1 phospholipase C [Dyella nitratireducens]
MVEMNRRKFLALSIKAAALGATGYALGGTIRPARAASTESTGTITDIKHVVILMQENRSFDHYFGTLQGVRGFADKAGITLSGGYSVFDQPNGLSRQYPWAFDTTSSAAGQTGEVITQCDGSLDHTWSTQHSAWNNGKMDAWVSAKGTVRTLGHLTRQDIPFHYALADAYTVCDHYFCSTLSATGPNRTYLWSGMIDPSGNNGGPAYDGGSESGLTWETYAEELQSAGVSWKVYQNASDNFGDNGLAFFSQFANAPTSSPLYQQGMASVPSTTGSTPNDIALAIQNDVLNGTLPQVSWIVASQDYSEHPDAPPDNGAHFINLVLQALAANADTLNATVLILNYDENDGFFDHVPPPVPPSGTAAEFITVNGQAQPIGMGFRVPMMICSPWTRGGVVDSQIYDHTSVIRFLETWTSALGTPAICSSISAWRRQVSGDLTGAFDFANPIAGLPANLPATSTIINRAGTCDPLPNPTASNAPNSLPVQESGTRTARALPYQPDANISSIQYGANGKILIWIEMLNVGAVATRAVPLAAYANAYRSGGPWQYTVAPYANGSNGSVSDYFNVGTGYGSGEYDLTVIGPNRFLRRFAGNLNDAGKPCSVTSSYAIDPVSGQLAIYFALTNGDSGSVTFTITANNYTTDGPWTYNVAAGATVDTYFAAVAKTNGWYDFTITVSGDASWIRRYTGHLETGNPSVTG